MPNGTPPHYTLTGITSQLLPDAIAACTASTGVPQVVNEIGGTFTLRCLNPAQLTNSSGSSTTTTPVASTVSSADNLKHDFTKFGLSHLGKPYIWGGNGPDTFDCSGLAQVLLAHLALDPPGDQTAHDLYRHFQQSNNGSVTSQATCGCLVFFGSVGKVGHVGVCLDAETMIEAAGGGPETTSLEAALRDGAKVKLSKITRRSDRVAIIRPAGLPWSDDGDASVGLLASAVALGPQTHAPDRPELRPHLDALGAYRMFILEAAGAFDLEPSLIAAVGSRESGWGTSNLLRPPGAGASGVGDWAGRRARTAAPARPAGLAPDGLGFGRGLMQIDWDSHEFARSGPWFVARENILYGARVLLESINHMRTNRPDAPLEDNIFAGVAGYNAGPSRIVRIIKNGGGRSEIDAATSGKDYASDTLSRAVWFRANGI